MCCRCNSHRQLVDRLAHRSIEIIQHLPVQYPAEGCTDVGAGQPKFDTIGPVDQLVLGPFQSTIGLQETRRKPTLIVERMTLTEPKTAFAGAMLAMSFARFKVSMAAFNAEMVFSRPSDSWDSDAMVEARGSCGVIVRREGCEEDSES